MSTSSLSVGVDHAINYLEAIVSVVIFDSKDMVIYWEQVSMCRHQMS